MQDEAYYQDLHERIVKGAEFIEKAKSDDPRLPVAHRKYDRMCEEYRLFIMREFEGVKRFGLDVLVRQPTSGV